MSSDEAIQLTNNDAANFKAYAVSKGYWNDPYLVHFAPAAFKPAIPGQQPPIEHKPPEMSRGYFARVNATRSAVYAFLTNANRLPSQCQVVNLGCGYDTLYFELCDRDIKPRKYVEIDFGRIVSSKVRIIKSKKPLNEKIWKPEPAPVAAVAASTTAPGDSLFKLPSLPVSSVPPGPNNEINTENYHLLSCDMRQPSEIISKLLKQCKLDPQLPTLFIFECVLVYMSGDHSSALLSALASTFQSCALVNYEQVNLSDKFGSIMLANMEARSCKLLGVDACASIDAQRERFTRAGFTGPSQVITMTDFYRTKMHVAERERIESIEFLDESELLFQLMDHYCICVVTNSSDLGDILF